MKESKLLKIISYALIPFLIIGIIIPLFYYAVQDEKGQNNYFSKEYFESEEFSYSYLDDLENAKRRIVDVMYNDYYNQLEVVGNNITYLDNRQQFTSRAKDIYYVIQYGNKIWTNVELTSKTDTFEKILEFIKQKDNVKYVDFTDNRIDTNSDVIKLYGIQSINTYKDEKYRVYKYSYEYNESIAEIKEENPNLEISENEVTYDNSQDIENNISTETFTNNEENDIKVEDKKYLQLYLDRLKSENPEVNIYEENGRIVYEFDSSKFQVYSSYIPEYNGEELISNIVNLLDTIERHENILPFILTISSILFLLIIVYLVISIGHDKGSQNIQLNDFDKLPLEILLIIDFIFGLIFILCAEREFFFDKYKLFINLIICMYFMYYVVAAINTNTIIKRIKAKSFWKTTFIGKIYNVSIKILKKIVKTVVTKIRNIVKEISNSLNITVKIALFCIFLMIILIPMLLFFGPFGLIVDSILIFMILYRIMEIISNYMKIENHLKKIYNGENVEKLKKEEFLKYFANTVEYINNMQNGYENAIKEGIKSERLKTELITNVSHDIKTPLTSIINYIDLLKQEKIQDEKINEYLNILDNKSQRLKKLTEDLVEASKASSGNVSLNVEKINVKELLTQSLGEFEDKFKDKNLVIEKQYPKDDVFINADNRYIYRVIENLFGNISKYALEGTRVYIDLETKENKVKINIKNISKNKLNITEEELMQRFVRGDKSRTTEGSGLGLSISKSLTELQKGTFKIEIDGDLFKVELSFDKV